MGASATALGAAGCWAAAKLWLDDDWLDDDWWEEDSSSLSWEMENKLMLESNARVAKRGSESNNIIFLKFWQYADKERKID